MEEIKTSNSLILCKQELHQKYKCSIELQWINNMQVYLFGVQKTISEKFFFFTLDIGD